MELDLILDIVDKALLFLPLKPDDQQLTSFAISAVKAVRENRKVKVPTTSEIIIEGRDYSVFSEQAAVPELLWAALKSEAVKSDLMNEVREVLLEKVYAS